MSTLLDNAVGWPFLVARGRRRGYRTLLAPAFLTEREAHERLSESARGAAPGRILSVEIDVPTVGALTVTYTVDELRPADLGADGPAGAIAPTDEHGRPLELLYGIVSRDRLSGPLDQTDLQTARDEALRSYRRFLAAEESFCVEPSAAVALRTLAVAPEAPVRPAANDAPFTGERAPTRGPEHARHRAGRMSAAASGLVAAGVVAMLLLGWLLWPSGPTVSTHDATATGPREAVTCGAPVAVQLRALIEVRDAPADIVYHWEQGATNVPLPEKVTLTIASAGTQPVTKNVTVQQAAPKLTFRLVIDEPVKQHATATYVTRCAGGAAR